MAPLSPQRVQSLRSLISEFLEQRRDDKLEKLKDDAEGQSKTATLRLQFIPSTWLADAAGRATQIQIATHFKPIPPDIKSSSLYCMPNTLPLTDAVSSRTLGTEFEVDVVGNAAVLDVYKFLKLSLDGRSLLELALDEDIEFAAALHEDTVLAREWMQAFAGLAERRGPLASHTLAKQVYWLTTDDPHDPQSFHLLAPLYPTSLVHRVYQQVQEDRFSDEAKAARAARKAGGFHPRPVREYSQLAVQKLGGTKPQNISQLNTERHGDNYLLASLPPVWKSLPVRPLLGVESLSKPLERRSQVRVALKALRRFLESEPPANIDTRQRVQSWIDGLIDEWLQFRAEMLSLAPGWTEADECQLSRAQVLWLDPDAAEAVPAEYDAACDAVARDFARWVNEHLRNPLPVGDPEFDRWYRLALEQFLDQEREAA